MLTDSVNNITPVFSLVDFKKTLLLTYLAVVNVLKKSLRQILSGLIIFLKF